ncbi:colicin E1 family microcin immunity protein [Pseudomonas aeruginosa]|nr:colicin E1 family microcin immunity protein [Pseudomonas aeruginosa]
MSFKYYWAKFFWGAFFFVLVAWKGSVFPSLASVNPLVVAGFSTILFPFSVRLVEDFALKYTEKEFWVTGFFSETLQKQDCMQSFIWLVICFQFPWG